MERWENKVAVITGASSGIGAACCKALLDKGMIVVGLARRHERIEKEYKSNLPKEQQNRFHAIKCDVSKEDDIKTAFMWVEEHLGGVDVLMNNAGITRPTQLLAENNTDDLRAILDVNVMGLTLCTREAFRSMKKRGADGHVILMNGISGHFPLNRKGTIHMYGPSKYAVTAITEVLRKEFLLNQTKIKVTDISPGRVQTEILGAGHKYPAGTPVLNVEDVADAVVFCIQTPPHVQIHELIIKPIGEEL